MTRRVQVAPALAIAAVFTCAVSLTSCAGADQQGSAAHRMVVWSGGTALGQDIGTLTADNARIPKVAPNGSGALHAACATLVTDAEKANGELPSPDPQVTAWLSEAYTLEATAGNQCFDGAANPSLLHESERNGIKAEALFVQALQRIRQIDGKAVSTTTTTDAGSSGGIFG